MTVVHSIQLHLDGQSSPSANGLLLRTRAIVERVQERVVRKGRKRIINRKTSGEEEEEVRGGRKWEKTGMGRRRKRRDYRPVHARYGGHIWSAHYCKTEARPRSSACRGKSRRPRTAITTLACHRALGLDHGCLPHWLLNQAAYHSLGDLPLIAVCCDTSGGLRMIWRWATHLPVHSYRFLAFAPSGMPASSPSRQYTPGQDIFLSS